MNMSGLYLRTELEFMYLTTFHYCSHVCYECCELNYVLLYEYLKIMFLSHCNSLVRSDIIKQMISRRVSVEVPAISPQTKKEPQLYCDVLRKYTVFLSRFSP